MITKVVGMAVPADKKLGIMAKSGVFVDFSA
jgi:hypothetical protein